MENRTVQAYAGRYHAAGISILPIAPDGAKAPPRNFKWGFLQTRVPTDQEIANWFSNGNGIAAVGGAVSGNLEDFDFDHLQSFEEWQKLIVEHLGQSFWERLVIVETPRPGRAVIIRCRSGVSPSQKLAWGRNPQFGKPNQVEFICLIETKSERGYFLLPGSPAACHPTGRTYDVIQGSFDHIPEITADERETMLACARSFDQKPRPIYEASKPRYRKPGDISPGDDYNHRGPEWREILMGYGYKFAFHKGDTTYWTRPGKDCGVSASTNHQGSGKFYPFSTNCYPFDNNRAYSKFAVFALMECNGNFAAAAKALTLQGFGTPPERIEPHGSAMDRDDETAAIHAEAESAWKGEGNQAFETTSDNSEPEISEDFIDPASVFLAHEDTPLEYLIPEITPAGALKCSHGDPRTMKSLAALEEFIAVGTGTPAFGLERFRPSRIHRALYCSQEDAEPVVRPRVRKLLAARGIAGIPDSLGFAVYKGIDFDSESWQERFIKYVLQGGYMHVTIDPIRGFTAHADEGPSKVIPVAKFLRRLTSRGIVIHLVHHDTKPPQNGPDARRRSHRASGGGWFSVSECPVSFEKVGDCQSLVIPEDYKFSQDPQPFTITYSEDELGLRLIGEGSSAGEAATLAIDEKVFAYVTENQGASGNAIAKGIHANRQNVGDSLQRLFRVDRLDNTKDGKAERWFLKGQKK